MIRKPLLVCLCLSVTLSLSLPVLRADEPGSPNKDIQRFVGTWKRVGTLDKDGKLQPLTDSYAQFKMVTPTHFTWFYVNQKTHQATIGFTGRCSATGDTYTETLDLMPGTSEEVTQPKPDANKAADAPADIPPVVCKSRVEGNRWYDTVPGSIFADKTDHNEVWERLKPGDKMF